jgi:hypothetical protein
MEIGNSGPLGSRYDRLGEHFQRTFTSQIALGRVKKVVLKE